MPAPAYSVHASYTAHHRDSLGQAVRAAACNVLVHEAAARGVPVVRTVGEPLADGTRLVAYDTWPTSDHVSAAIQLAALDRAGVLLIRRLLAAPAEPEPNDDEAS